MKNAARIFALPFVAGLTALFGLSACEKSPQPIAEAAPIDTESMVSRLESLTREVESAEALRSVKRLQWAYGHYSELGLWYDFADLFADTGVGHYTQGDLNRDEVRALFFDQVGQGRLGLAEGRIYPHISFSPVVDLAEDGMHANGRFRILGMLGGYGGNATWFHGVYENAYVKERGVWKLDATSNAAQITGNFTAGLSAQSKAPLDAPTFAFHYDSGQVGKVPVAVPADPVIYNDPPQLAPLVYSLQQRLARLDDEAAVTRLQHQYGYYLDQHDWDALAELFAEQGTFETGQQGVYVGTTSIRNALDQFGELAQGQVDEHILFQTYVSIAPDGLSAKARVDQLGLQGKPGASAEWTQGIYENAFVKEDGEWRIQALHYYPRLITDYDKGWGADAQPAPGPSDAYPPDAPPTETYGIYPTFHIPAFHFTHPVTGQAPQYPEGDPAIGQVAGFATIQLPGVNQSTDNAVLQAQLDAAELQSQRALAVDAVENLLNAYAYYLDECMTQDAAVLFEENGSIEIPGIGIYRGTGRIANALNLAQCSAGRQEDGLTLHHVLQPLVSINEDGRTATVTARLWQVHATGADDDYYLMGLVNAVVVKQGTQWKLATVTTQYDWAASVKEGWARATENEALGYAAPLNMLTEFPPDMPAQTARLAPYP